MEIKVEKKQLLQLSDRMLENQKKIKKIKFQLERTTIDLASHWQGGSYDNFKNKIENEYIRELGSFHEQLEKYAIYLKQASKLYQKLETTFRYKKLEK
ncbi:MAG: hypothetical protein HFH86_01875 [Bacilli bacterium]|jgi:uncharacterized protein YukE|nr:hypothetical protein [Bacilli bacterium]